MCPLTFLLAFLLSWTAHAQQPAQQWQTLDTGHFRIHYPLEAEPWTLDAASHLEAIHARVVAEVGFLPPRIIDVVVMDPFGRPNGFALPVLSMPRMGVFPVPPGADSSLANYHSWSEELMTHEDVHLAHLLRPSRNLGGRLFSLLAPISPLAWKSPMWVIEGYATMLEGKLTGYGRPGGDARAVFLRSLAQEGKLPRYGQLAGATTWMGGAYPYLVGSAFLEWLVRRQGDDSLNHLWDRMTSKHFRTFKAAFQGVYGDTPRALYAQFQAEAAHATLLVNDSRPQDEGTLWLELEGSPGAPAVADDGTRIAMVWTPPDEPARLQVWALADDGEAEARWRKRQERILRRDPQDAMALPPQVFPREPQLEKFHGDWRPEGVRWIDTRTLLFTAWYSLPDGSSRPDLVTWDLQTDRLHRVTHGAGVQDADPLAGRAVAVRQFWGASQLVWVDLQSGEWEPLTEARADTVLDHPRVSPDGRQLAYLRHRGAWRLVLRDLSEEKISQESAIQDYGLDSGEIG